MAEFMTVGRLSDGRWFAERTGYGADPDDRQQGAIVFSSGDGEALALRMAQRWMNDGEWREQPAAFDAHGRPVDGRPWRRRGSDWYLPDDAGEER